ncbi:MAG: type II toxin-antitoxin system RelE/ParE family toxin [Candidatus Sericytochromatia bacterium]|nr:type II toxin-antitoxin system RelE/ParE family toxin [Candidatus Sericytochromatia bacterium]
MRWTVLTTDEFDTWFSARSPKAQAKLDTHILMLESAGPTLPARYSKPIVTSRHAVRELRVQVGGDPYRVLRVFDPRRNVILLVGGDKTGDDRWYDKHVPLADKLHDAHLAELDERKDKEDG